VVDDEQLSLAIGKKGQNVRLASRLCGWKIDIKSEQDKKREVQAEMERMARDRREIESLEGIGSKNIEKVAGAGYRGVEEILAAGIDGLSQVPGIGAKTAEKIVAAAQQMLDTRPDREERERLALEQAAAEEAAARQAQEDEAARQAAVAEAARLAAAPAAAESGLREAESPEDPAGPGEDPGEGAAEGAADAAADPAAEEEVSAGRSIAQAATGGPLSDAGSAGRDPQDRREEN
jgi:N utilization substance protein A